MIVKRALDLSFAALGLILLSPLLAVLAALVKFSSPGPVFFRQERVGLHGKPFRIHKFRTMRSDTADRGPLITAEGDSRITRAGRWLRRYKLDELPQLIDVLAGDMSLVGPRPEVPRFVAAYPEAMRQKILSVRPGITDVASLEFIDENKLLAAAVDPEREYLEKILPHKLLHYAAYVENRSLSMDLAILVRTLASILKR
jgi:lipopolysaccharide/colanic/teichoic acid biosynthesis glycosyltransferase